MLPSRTPSRGKIAVAIGLSLALHALGALAWISMRGGEIGGPVGVDSRVDTPKGDFAVTFLDPPKREFVVQPKTRPPEPPRPVPPVEDVRPQPGPGPGGVTPSGHSPDPPVPLTSPARLLGGKSPAGTVVFVIDRSSSMGTDGLLPRAVAETLAAIGQLDANTRFQVVAYNGGAAAAPGGLRNSSLDTRMGVEQWLKTLTAEGRSDHRAGIREALTHHPTHIFLLTDADDLESQEANELNGLLKGQVALDAVVFGTPGVRAASETPLERLVRVNRGSVRYLGP